MDQRIQTHHHEHHQRRRSTNTLLPPPPSQKQPPNSDPLLIQLLSTTLIFFFPDSQTLPSRLAHAASALLRRLSFGLFAAIHAVSLLVTALAVAVLIGVVLVGLLVENPVVFRHPLHFDYTNEHPSAVVEFGGAKGRVVPGGHTVSVYLELLMPDSGYNRYIGVFQVTAEAISSNSEIIASSSKPCMLRFRSLPVRLTQTFIMAVPLLLGVCSESQKIAFEILKYKEIYQKPTERIMVRLKPRAGTFDLPQLYEAEIVMNSQLPWRKQVVYDWKWTFYVWISLYVYLLLLIVLFCCFKQFGFPRRASYPRHDHHMEEEEDVSKDRELETNDFSAALRRWSERGRRKRKVEDVLEESASSITAGEMGEVIEDNGDFAASESSECIGG